MDRRRRSYNPFEVLEDFEDLRKLVSHVLESLEVKIVKVRMPFGFIYSKIRNPLLLLPVTDILVGDATYEYIKHRAEYILDNTVKRIEKINTDKSLSFADKFELFTDIRKSIEWHYRYYDSMNPVRYMSAFKWKIVYSETENDVTVEKEQSCVNSELDIKDWQWNVLENNLLIRRHLLYEIIYLLDVELEKLQSKLSGNKYTWESKEPYEIYELLYALLASKRIDLGKGNENTFAHDFLAFFGVSDLKLAYKKDKVMSRGTKSQFLPILMEAFEKSGPQKIKNSKK